METAFRADTRINTLYNDQEITAISRQIKKRWFVLGIPGLLLTALLVYAVVIRNEMLANVATIALGALLIAGYDLTLKPLYRYRTHLRNVLHGRVRQVELPFVAISTDVSEVAGVPFRSVTCTDYDAKGRPYERLFYFDAHKEFPVFRQGDRVLVVHHDLTIADILRT